MKKMLLPAIAAAMMITSCNNSGKTTATSTNSSGTNSASMEDNTGFTPLFDGKTTAGWHNYGKTTVGSAWKVADGALYLDTAKKDGWQTGSGGDIVTDKDYGNFHLKLDWKIAPNGNSGVIFLVHEDTAKYKYVWNTGPEMQVLDNDGHPDGKIPKHRAGNLYDLIASSSEPVKAVGDWNHLEIIVKNGKLDLMLNGVNVVSTTMWDDNWKALVAGSKFKAYPDFGTYKRGKIALQDHGNMVWFKNVMIKEL